MKSDVDISLNARTTSKLALFQGPTLNFVALALLLLGGVAILAEMLFAAPLVPIVVFLIISGLCLRDLSGTYPHDRLGACNAVTLLRAALVSVLAGTVFAPVSLWVVFFIAVFVLVSDGVDGWLARRSGLSSAFGARFDMETDALLGAILALVVLSHGTAGPAILVLGFSRYVFVAAGSIWGALQGALQESYSRKTICVIQIASLILLVCPLTPVAVTPYIAMPAACLLLYSFTVDAWALLRRDA